MQVTIGICTKDNYTLLDKCLKSLNSLIVSDDLEIQIIIIDQSDQQKKITNKICFPIKQVCCQHRGISFSRNHLFDLADGDYLFITDDDLIVDEFWLIHTLKLFESDNTIGVIGGKIIQQNKTPQKFKKTLKILGYSKNFWPYALFDLGNRVKKLNIIVHYPCFANLAIKKYIYKKIRLDTDFANQQKLLKIFGGEDPVFIEQAKKICDIVYNPKMVAAHYIKPYKFTQRYFYWRYREWGKERALLEIKYYISANASFRRTFYSLMTILRKLKRRQNFLNEWLDLIFAISFYKTVFIFKVENIFNSRQ